MQPNCPCVQATPSKSSHSDQMGLARCLRAPALQLVLTPCNQIVHVFKQLLPSHHTRSVVRLDELGALRALGVRANLLAHVLANLRQLVLQLHAVGQILAGARALRGGALLELRRLSMPVLDLVLAPCDEVVHVLEQLLPGHHSWSVVWLHEIRALVALGVSADLLAHVLANLREFVLKTSTNLGLLGRACLLTDDCLLGDALLQCRRLRMPTLQLVLAPRNQIVHMFQQFRPGHDAWCRVWFNELWALGTLWVRTDLFAHVLADACQLVLEQ